MKLKIAHEELWVTIINGSHDDCVVVDLPDEIANRCIKAQEEWEACIVILEKAHEDNWDDTRRRKRSA